MKRLFESERLYVRYFAREDWRDLHAYLTDEANLQFEPYDPLTLEQVRHEACRREGDSDYYAVCLKDGGRMIGNLYFKKGDFETWELGYIFNRFDQGRGYATEAARALLDYGFGVMGVRRVIALCSTDNTASWRLLERLGMRREGLFLKNVAFKEDREGNPIWFDSYQYAVLRDEWPGCRAGARSVIS